MRFGELGGLTSLPIPRLRDQFRNEEVLTVLPVQDAATSRETLFVATRTMLAVLSALPEQRGLWMTRWAPWDVVRISDPGAPQGPDDEVYRLSVLVGGRTFHAQLLGEKGRRALRDFVVAARTLHPANVPRR